MNHSLIYKLIRLVLCNFNLSKLPQRHNEHNERKLQGSDEK